MKTLIALGSSGMLVGGLYAGDVLTPGEVYDRPIAQARADLVSMDLPPLLLLSTGASNATRVTVSADERSVRWTLMSGDRKAATFNAHLSEEGASRTRVVVEQTATAPGTQFGDRLTATRFMRSFAHSNLVERIDARLEGRPFDQGRALDDFAQHASENPEELREVGEEVRGMFQQVHEELQHGMEASVTPEVDNTRAKMEAATRPSMNVRAD